MVEFGIVTMVGANKTRAVFHIENVRLQWGHWAGRYRPMQTATAKTSAQFHWPAAYMPRPLQNTDRR
jgi:hypothetical protein